MDISWEVQGPGEYSLGGRTVALEWPHRPFISHPEAAPLAGALAGSGRLQMHHITEAPSPREPVLRVWDSDQVIPTQGHPGFGGLWAHLWQAGCFSGPRG